MVENVCPIVGVADDRWRCIIRSSKYIKVHSMIHQPLHHSKGSRLISWSSKKKPIDSIYHHGLSVRVAKNCPNCGSQSAGLLVYSKLLYNYRGLCHWAHIIRTHPQVAARARGSGFHFRASEAGA